MLYPRIGYTRDAFGCENCHYQNLLNSLAKIECCTREIRSVVVEVEKKY